jgi:tetratricopeptide (TPR) repeat protein
MLAHADLAGYAGQFVWLELNFDKPENQAFFSQFAADATPTFFIVNPEEKVIASQTGAMSLAELLQFPDRGISNTAATGQNPADLALERGDTLAASRPAEASEAYREALRVAPAAWPRRKLAEASLAEALESAEKWQECAETAASEAANMKLDVQFSRTVLAGIWCVVRGGAAPWSPAAAEKLAPLTKEALAMSTTVRDHRDKLYRALMYLALSRNDRTQAAEWGDKWLAELDSIRPASEEERSAVDIARVEAIETYGDPERILPALQASERAMPRNYNASLRLAQMENAARHYDDAIAACDRGLRRQPGALGRSWLLQTKADALTQKGRLAEARSAFTQALEAAKAIPNPKSREHNIKMIRQRLGAS